MIDFRIFNENLIGVFETTSEVTSKANSKFVTIDEFLCNISVAEFMRRRFKEEDQRRNKLGGNSNLADSFFKIDQNPLEIHDWDLVHKFFECAVDTLKNDRTALTEVGGQGILQGDVESKKNPGFSADFDLILEKAKRLYDFRKDGQKFANIPPVTKRTEGDRTKIDIIDVLNIITFYRDRFHLGDLTREILDKSLTYSRLYQLMQEEFNSGYYRLREDFKNEQVGNKLIRIIGIELSSEALDLANILDDILTGGILKEKRLDWDDTKNSNVNNTTEKIDMAKKKNGGNLFDNENDLFEKAGAEGKILSKQQNDNTQSSNTAIPTLDQYGRNLNNAVQENKIDPVIGREKEIDQLIDVLRCRKKTSAILIGEAGCGKTAVVEGLARKLNSNDVPDCLKGKKVYSITTSDLTAGTMYRGQLEERLQNIINELKTAKNVILYIDEFHQATGEEKSTSIADILKPALSRGEISVIASTTTREYKKFVEKDAALRRRFQKIIVEEPTKEATFNIIKGLAEAYSEHHKVNYTDEVLKMCVDWSDKYIYDRRFPDKAIDVLDIAGSFAAKENVGKEKSENVKKWEKIRAEKIKAVCDADFDKGFKLRDKETELKEKYGIINSYPNVSLANVASVISRYSNIPVDKILNPEMDKLRTMKQELLNKIIGQDEAIKTATMSLSKSYLGLRDESKPIAALMFVGPTGVGKTMLCEEICKTIFGDPKALVRIDCGEYSQPHTVTKLIGAPASYVGYGEPGILDQIRERPNSLVLFDEIEKMHPDIINTLFLNILSTGMITMSNGVEVSFRNCIVVFTGNVGTKELELKGNGIGFGELNSDQKNSRNNTIIRDALKKQFRPEFINRLTNITVFNELSKEDMVKIFELELNKLKERLDAKNYKITITDELKEFIISKVDTKYGARDLSRGITTWVEDKICEYMLEKSCAGKSTFELSLKKDTTVVKAK